MLMIMVIKNICIPVCLSGSPEVMQQSIKIHLLLFNVSANVFLFADGGNFKAFLLYNIKFGVCEACVRVNFPDT